jgi:hypothetical protein
MSFPIKPAPPPPITALLSQAQSLVSKSWEHGTLCEALLEVYDPSLSVFSRASFGANGSQVPRVVICKGREKGRERDEDV